jgi:hypothetical protein
MSKFWKIAGIATLVAVVGVVALVAVTFAQGPPVKPPFPMRMLAHGPFGGRGHPAFGPFGGFEGAEEYREEMHAAVAEALGKSVEELEAAIADGQTLEQIAEAQGVDLADVWSATTPARQRLLQRAVEDELLTQRQADWISERMAEYGPGRFGRGRFSGHFGGGRGHFAGPFSGSEEIEAYREQMHAAVAEALGKSVEEFDAALAEGQTPCQIAEAQGLDPAEVWAATESTRQDLLQQAVEDELLTQQQADWIGERMAAFDANQWCAGDGPGHGMWGMGKGFHGFPSEPGDVGE